MILNEQILTVSDIKKDNDIIWNYLHLTDRQIGNLYLIQKINSVATIITAIALIIHMVK